MIIHHSILRFATVFAAVLMAFASRGQAATIIWDGSTDMSWTQPDTTSWSGGTYNSGDTAQFPGSGAGVVAVVSVGVTPGAVVVSNANYKFTGGGIGGTGTTFTVVTNALVTLNNSNTYTGQTLVKGNCVLDVGTISGGGLSANSGLFLGDTTATSGIYGILQGNGSFTRSLSGNTTPSSSQVGCAAGGFAARGGTLTVNFGGAGAQISMNQGGYKFGNNFVFGSTSADSKVVFQNDIDLNTTGGQRIFTVTAGVGGDAATSAELSGKITNSLVSTLAILKNGNGLLILSGTNTYTGSTIINAGTLNVNGALATGAVTVNSGGTLGGGGKINGAVTVNSGGALAPGGATNGTLTLASNLTFNAGANAVFWLNTTNGAGTNAQLAVAGTQSITGGTLTVTNLGPALAVGASFKLLGKTNNAGNFTTINLPAGYNWANKLTVDGTIQVMATATPSPTNLNWSLNSQQFILNWPTGQGWRLQVQTNPIGTGLSTNWVTLSNAAPPYTNLVNSTNPSVFYRLRYP